MTAARGVTPRGLPYPGPADPVYGIPNYLQQLADAVQAQLDSAGAGVLLVTFTGLVSTNSNGFAIVTVPGLKIVRGALAMTSNTGGGSGPWIFFLSASSWTDANQAGKAIIGVAKPTADSGAPGYPGMVKSASNVGLNFIAWGDPP
jgi:hypothetical protein